MSQKTALSESNQPMLASRRRRLFAICIDVVITAVASVGLLLVSGLLEGPEAYVGAQVLYRAGAVVIIAYLFVNAYPLARRGQSLGKILTKIRVTSFASNGHLPLWKLLLRSIGVVFLLFVPPLGLFFAGIFVLDSLLIFGKFKRRGHDVLFGSRVVNN